MRFPLITTKRRDAEMTALMDAHAEEIARLTKENDTRRIQTQHKHAEELEQVVSQVDDLVKRISCIEVDRFDGSPNILPRFRVAVDIDPRFMMEAFVHGDSQRDMELIAERIGRQVRRELTNINVWRSAEYGRYMAGDRRLF